MVRAGERGTPGPRSCPRSSAAYVEGDLRRNDLTHRRVQLRVGRRRIGRVGVTGICKGDTVSSLLVFVTIKKRSSKERKTRRPRFAHDAAP